MYKTYKQPKKNKTKKTPKLPCKDKKLNRTKIRVAKKKE